MLCLDDLLRKEMDLIWEYDQDIGAFYWKINKGSVKIGDFVGSRRVDGRIQTKILGKMYKVHRLIFFYVHNYWPNRIDHRDGNPENNRIDNLRDCTAAENSWNVKAHKDNDTGFHNVSYRGGEVPYRVQYSRFGKCVHNSYHTTFEEACKVSRTIGESLGNFQNPQ